MVIIISFFRHLVVSFKIEGIIINSNINYVELVGNKNRDIVFFLKIV